MHTARCWTTDLGDRRPAETFACSFRLTGRLFRRRPQESQILLANGIALLSSDIGLAPRALRDIEAGVAAGRFTVDDPELALSVAGGALLGLGNLLRNQPQRDDAAGVRFRHRGRFAAIRAAFRRSSRNLSTTPT